MSAPIRLEFMSLDGVTQVVALVRYSFQVTSPAGW